MFKKYLLLSLCVTNSLNIGAATKAELALIFLDCARHGILQIKRHPLMAMTNQGSQAILPLADEKAFKQSCNDLFGFKQNLARDKRTLLAQLSCTQDLSFRSDLENILTQLMILETEVSIKINLLKKDVRYESIKMQYVQPDWFKLK